MTSPRFAKFCTCEIFVVCTQIGALCGRPCCTTVVCHGFITSSWSRDIFLTPPGYSSPAHLMLVRTCIFLRAGKLRRMFETFGILENFAKRKCCKNKYPYGTFLQNCRLGNPRIHAWHSAVIREPSVDTSRMNCGHLTKGLRNHCEDTVDLKCCNALCHFFRTWL